MYHRFILCMNLTIAVCTSTVGLLCFNATHNITRYICSTLPDLAEKAYIE